MGWLMFRPRPLALLVGLTLLAFLASTPALAAPGGKHGRDQTTAATLSVSPNPVPAWGGQYTVAGSGFAANKAVSFSIASPGCCLAFNVWADSSGRVSFSRTTGSPGTYKIDAYQLSGRKYALMATVSFNVDGP